MAGANTSQHDVMVLGLAAWSDHEQPFKGTIRVKSNNVVGIARNNSLTRSYRVYQKFIFLPRETDFV